MISSYIKVDIFAFRFHQSRHVNECCDLLDFDDAEENCTSQ